jgi:hypothetical protein
LPANDADLENIFIWQEYVNVSTDDEIRVAQTATDQFSVFLFKDKATTNTKAINVSWNGQSDRAPSSSAVYLQIFNRTSGLWETLDSDNATAVNTDFALSGVKSTGLTNYYDANFWVACRVYQEAI